MDRIEEVEEGDNIEYGWTCTGLKKLKRGDNIEYEWSGLKKRLKRGGLLSRIRSCGEGEIYVSLFIC